VAPLLVELDLDSTLDYFPIDVTAMRSALSNIAKNALEAMALQGCLTVRTRRSGDHLVMRFRDTGPGIDSEAREKIFDPFFTTKDKGVGLGLAIAHKAVVAHNGRIHVLVPAGGGCEFVIRIPDELGKVSAPNEFQEGSGISRAEGWVR
jgi:two-component system sensor histidine kinase HydH